VKYPDCEGVEHRVIVEAESLFEAAVLGLIRLQSSFWDENSVLDGYQIVVEVYEAPTVHAVKLATVKRWLRSHGKSPREEAKKIRLRHLPKSWTPNDDFRSPKLALMLPQVRPVQKLKENKISQQGREVYAFAVVLWADNSRTLCMRTVPTFVPALFQKPSHLVAIGQQGNLFF
jgi:hypothetical protein